MNYWKVGLILIIIAGLSGWFITIDDQPVNATFTRSEPLKRGAAIISVRDEPGKGVGVSSSLQKVQDLEMQVVYHYLGWDTIEIKPGIYNWAILDDILGQVRAYDLQIVLRIYNPPVWYNTYGSMAEALAADHYVRDYTKQEIRDFMQALTTHVEQTGHANTVVGYVVWNEPNIKGQWGAAPNAAAYMEMLQAAYEGAKQGDPNAIIVSAPLAPTANKSGVAISDLTYLEQLYQHGLANYVDYVSMIGLGFHHPPNYDAGVPDFSFMRLKYLHEIMVANGDIHRKMWALEVGWLRDNTYDMGEFNAFKVSAQQQTEYIEQAFEIADRDWPWLDLITVWNLDFNRHYPPTSNFHWYSIDVNPQDTPLQTQYQAYLPLIAKYSPPFSVAKVAFGYNDRFVKFSGHILNEQGNLLNGYSVLATNGGEWPDFRRQTPRYAGTIQLISHPTGPSVWYPQNSHGAWDIGFDNVSDAQGWWWLTLVRYECDFEAGFDVECDQFTPLSETIAVEIDSPENAELYLDWVCHRDCDEGVYQ